MMKFALLLFTLIELAVVLLYATNPDGKSEGKIHFMIHLFYLCCGSWARFRISRNLGLDHQLKQYLEMHQS